MNEIDDKDLARALSLTRMAVGTFLLLAPGRAARAWVGESATPGLKLTVRAVGGRDLALGLGTAMAIENDNDPSRWLEAGAIADMSDAASILFGFRRLPRLKALLWLATSATATVVGLQLAESLDG